MNVTQIWGKNDCFTWLAPQGAPRPEWLRDCETVIQGMRKARELFGSQIEAYEYCAQQFGLQKIECDAYDAVPGDRVFGKDDKRGEVGAVVGEDYAHYVRTPTGFARANWVGPVSVWRMAEDGNGEESS